jgi:enamine deaminase RidA (YjgF/YER057c/UK114 family)
MESPLMLKVLGHDRSLSRSFRAGQGDSEHHLVIEAPAGLSFDQQLRHIQSQYAEVTESLGLGPETAIFRRLFLSDVMNQAASVRNSPLAADDEADPVAVSIVQQSPLAGSKIAMLAYHIATPGKLVKKRFSTKHLLVKKNGRRHLWSTRMCAGAFDAAPSSSQQTRHIFDGLIDTLSDLGGNLAAHCVRTWIYLRNVDVFYQGMVDSRRELFNGEGLRADTHYIASTGIEGACSHRYDVVSMDAYSILDLEPNQICYLNDFEKLCATKDYSVTFERGTRIAYADRAHHFISGTASIDNQGNVVHVGDVMKQLDRTLENIGALLRSGGAWLGDMMHMIVYLRDPADYARVNDRLREQFPDLPIIIVQGAVCRPEWLIEIEGIAAVARQDPALPAF